MSEPATVTKTAPERIWLQHSDDMLDVDLPFPEEHDGISWCHEQVFMGDVEYIRSDLCATPTGAGMSECKCNLREKLVGDGCEVCNPAKSLEYAKETIEELTQQRDMLLEALKKIEQVEAGTVTTSYDMQRIASSAIAAVEGEK